MNFLEGMLRFELAKTNPQALKEFNEQVERERAAALGPRRPATAYAGNRFEVRVQGDPPYRWTKIVRRRRRRATLTDQQRWAAYLTGDQQRWAAYRE